MIPPIFTLLGLLGFAPYSLPEVEKTIDSPYRELRLLDHNPTIPAAAYQSAAKGNIATGLQTVNGHAAKIGWGVAIFDIPLAHLYASINEEERHIDLTAVSYAKVLKGAPCSDGREVLMILPLPIISDRWWITHQYTNPQMRKQSNNQAAELIWKEVPNWLPPAEYQSRLEDAVQIPFTQGSWFLLALDERHTLAEYHSWVDPGGNIPAGPASEFATGSIEDTFQQMAQYAKGQSKSMCDSIFQ